MEVKRARSGRRLLCILDREQTASTGVRRPHRWPGRHCGRSPHAGRPGGMAQQIRDLRSVRHGRERTVLWSSDVLPSLPPWLQYREPNCQKRSATRYAKAFFRARYARAYRQRTGKRYPFSSSIPTTPKMKGKKNPYTKYLKRPVTMRSDRDSVDYFKSLAEESGIPYQTLINPYLRDCALHKRKLDTQWSESTTK